MVDLDLILDLDLVDLDLILNLVLNLILHLILHLILNLDLDYYFDYRHIDNYRHIDLYRYDRLLKGETLIGILIQDCDFQLDVMYLLIFQIQLRVLQL
jgi:hypothetical protein